MSKETEERFETYESEPRKKIDDAENFDGTLQEGGLFEILKKLGSIEGRGTTIFTSEQLISSIEQIRLEYHARKDLQKLGALDLLQLSRVGLGAKGFESLRQIPRSDQLKSHSLRYKVCQLLIKERGNEEK